MKKITNLFALVLILIVCTNCSGNKQSQSSNEFDTSDQLFVDAMDTTSTPVEVAAETVQPTTSLEAGHVEISEIPNPPVADETINPIVENAPGPSAEVETFITEAQVETPAVVRESNPGVYDVRRGDTWMIISQKLLGNPLKWRQIQKMNPEFKKSSDLYVGAKLSYVAPEKPVVEPDGLPYLIKMADTLPKISKKVYGTKNQWDVIYYNNREVIKTPDVIYSGFIIYYPEMERVPTIKIEMAEMKFNARGPRRPASVKIKK